MLKDHVIFGVHITDRVKHVSEVQKVFTEFGCHIKTRIGLHDVDENYCSPNGLLLLELVGDRAGCDEMKARLTTIEGVEVQSMVFHHP